MHYPMKVLDRSESSKLHFNCRPACGSTVETQASGCQSPNVDRVLKRLWCALLIDYTCKKSSKAVSKILSVPRFLCAFSPHTLSLTFYPSIFHFSKPDPFSSSLHIIISSNTFSPLSLSISFWGSLIQGWSIERGSGSEQETSVPVSFTKLGPSVSYSAFHLLPIRREITCTIFIILSKPFVDFLLHNLAQCRRLPKCSLKHIYFHIFTYKIHVYTYTCWLDNLLGTNI